MLKSLVFSLIFFILPSFVWAQDPGSSAEPLTFEKAFQSGVEAYQKQDYTAAQAFFTQALKERPDESSTLTNLALTHSRLGQKGWALAYLRKTLALNPHHNEARTAYDFILRESPPQEIPHQIQLWESLRNGFLMPFSVLTLSFLALFLFFSSAWSWLSYLGKRRRALQAEHALPAAPVLPSLFTLLFLTVFTLALAKAYAAQETRATIILEKVSALTAPREQSPSLFELFEGLEVLVRETQGDWMQVTYPGALTGWIPKNSLFVTQGGR